VNAATSQSSFERALIDSNAREAADLVGELTLLLDRVDQGNTELATARMVVRRIADRLGQASMLERLARRGNIGLDLWSPLEILEELEHEAVSLARSRIEVSVSAPDLVPQCWFFDRELVTMSLANALHSALHHANRVVSLQLRLEAGCLGFCITDDAGAFPAGVVSELDGAAWSSAEINGNALGIHFARLVAKAHFNRGVYGRVELVNRTEGPGTRFTLWLP
jgi:signal transduction histidine kinase